MTMAQTQEELLLQAQARVSHHADISSTFFVHFTPALEGPEYAELEKVKNDVKTWHKYLSALASIKVQEMINAGELPRTIDPVAGAMRSTYNTKIFAQMLHGISRPWMRHKHAEQEKKGVFSCSKGDFHSQLTAKMLDGFASPCSAVNLERSLATVCGNIAKVAATNPNQTVEYLIVLIRFESKKGTIAPVVRVVNLETTPELSGIAKKSSSEPIQLSLNYTQYESDFDIDLFRDVASAFPRTIVKGGRNFLTKAADLDVMVAAT